MVTIPIYADSTDLATWTGTTAPDNADALLRTASLIVRAATKTAVYAVDDNSVPSDTDIAEAFRDATCAQAAALDANDVDPFASTAGAAQEIASSSIGSASVSFVAGGSGAMTASLLAALCVEAAMILSGAGLLGQEALTGRTGP